MHIYIYLSHKYKYISGYHDDIRTDSCQALRSAAPAAHAEPEARGAQCAEPYHIGAAGFQIR